MEQFNADQDARRAAEEIRKLKQQPGGDIRIIGSATLVQSLMKENLIDEYWLMVHPLF
jgi:dihydrofolate reductase